MGDEDLRDLFAFGALIGLVMKGGIQKSTAEDAYAVADDMIAAKYDGVEDVAPEEVGIAAVVKRTRKKHG